MKVISDILCLKRLVFFLITKQFAKRKLFYSQAIPSISKLLSGLKMSNHSCKAVSSSRLLQSTAAWKRLYPGGRFICKSFRLNFLLFPNPSCVKSVFLFILRNFDVFLVCSLIIVADDRRLLSTAIVCPFSSWVLQNGRLSPQPVAGSNSVEVAISSVPFPQW